MANPECTAGPGENGRPQVTPALASMRIGRGSTMADFQAGFQSLTASVDPASASRQLEVHPYSLGLADEAWFVAERCGFAKVYDAASVALARLRGCRLVTLDARLMHSPAQRLATLVGPAQI